MMRGFRWTAWIGLALATLLASPAWSQGLCDAFPLGDSDADGFDDVIECLGIQLLPGLTFNDANGTASDFVPGCAGSGAPAEFCMDPNKQTLFVIVVRGNPSGLPADILSFTSAPAAEGGLGVTVIALGAADPTGDRTVSAVSAQKAVRITESRDAPGDKLGLANYGTPNGLDGSTIWTARIEAFVAAQCAGVQCQTDRGAVGQGAVTDALVRWVLNHEGGHLYLLTAVYNSRFGGFHEKAGENEVMTQFVAYNTNRKTGITTFFIPSTYSDRSRADKLLR